MLLVSFFVCGLFMNYSKSPSVVISGNIFLRNDSIVHGLAGLWSGNLRHTMKERIDTTHLEFDIRETSSSYTGVWQSNGIENGLSELAGFFFDGKKFHFHETNGRYVSGTIVNNKMTGQVAWSDTTKAWANIELVRK
jgi:hypothetical protein